MKGSECIDKPPVHFKGSLTKDKHEDHHRGKYERITVQSRDCRVWGAESCSWSKIACVCGERLPAFSSRTTVWCIGVIKNASDACCPSQADPRLTVKEE